MLLNPTTRLPVALAKAPANRRQGFTVVEMLVVVGILTVVAVAVVDIFASVTRSQRRVYANQQLQGDVRNTLERIARDVHQGTIDYGYYQAQGIDLTAQVNVLALRDSVNQPNRYRENGEAIEVSSGNSGIWVRLNAAAVKVVSFRFRIAPRADPFQPCPNATCSGVPDEQPRVVVNLTAQVAPRLGDPVTALTTQTTLATRTYRR